MGTDVEKLGVVGEDIVNKFNLTISPNTPIFIGLKNRIHMENNHDEIYQQYSDCMSDIISSPDYVGINPHDNSLEYYKDYDGNIIHVKLAARPTKNGVFFARSMYDVNDVSLKSYLRKGRIKAV